MILLARACKLSLSNPAVARVTSLWYCPCACFSSACLVIEAASEELYSSIPAPTIAPIHPDTVDDTHLFMFHQLEALVVDKGVTMVDLKSTIMQFVHAYFGPETKARFRPSFFPFTEPSAEVDVWFEDKQRWIELGGCGMVHPNVLRAGGVDPEEYSGFAFGFGIDRLALMRHGVDDLREFYTNDARFLAQF